MGSSSSKQMSVFGGRIGDHLDEDGINKIVKWLLEAIERTGLGVRTVGLYRVCGGHEGVQRTSRQSEIELKTLVEKEKDVHVLSGSLKLYLRSLKEPILNIEDFREAIKGRRNGEDTSDKLREVVCRLPDSMKLTLSYLFRHLNRVMHETRNHMSLASLGVVFGPALMRVNLPAPAAQEDHAALEASLEELNLVVELLLQHYNKVFNDHTTVDKSDSESRCTGRHARVAVDPSVHVAELGVGGDTAGVPVVRVADNQTFSNAPGGKPLSVGSYPDNESYMSSANRFRDVDKSVKKRTSLPSLGAARRASEAQHVSVDSAIMSPTDVSEIEDWLVHTAKALTPDVHPNIASNTGSLSRDLSDNNNDVRESMNTGEEVTTNIEQTLNFDTKVNVEGLINEVAVDARDDTDLNFPTFASVAADTDQSTNGKTLEENKEMGEAVVKGSHAGLMEVLDKGSGAPRASDEAPTVQELSASTSKDNLDGLQKTVDNEAEKSELEIVYEKITQPRQYYHSSQQDQEG